MKRINGVQIVPHNNQFKLVLMKHRCIVHTYGVFDTCAEAVSYKYHTLNITI